MSAPIVWQIPPSVRRWLDEVPRDRPVAVLMRHSVRPYLPPGDAGFTTPITEDGERLGRGLGCILGSRLRSLHSSPLPRCVQTSEALRTGAGASLAIPTSRLLGDPGVFVLDGHRAWSNWQERGHEGVMAHLVSEREPLPGMAAADEAARFLVQHMLTVGDSTPGLHVFVTHDSLVTATAARLLGIPYGQKDWPWYLESAFFWREGETLHAAYRDDSRACLSGPLCHMEDRDVIEFARREIEWTLGPDVQARFFLAGGAFRTLLTGRPPRDLDLWAPTPDDREHLVRHLKDRGARRTSEGQYAETFELRDRVIEVPRKTEPTTLEERLARFDIALSAVGVEHRPGGRWRAMVHPLALESAKRSEVLLLKPLVNWKYALPTLERARRYAADLGYRIPPEEEAEVWRVFDSQTPEMQQGMLERLERTTICDHGVRQEALCRLR